MKKWKLKATVANLRLEIEDRKAMVTNIGVALDIERARVRKLDSDVAELNRSREVLIKEVTILRGVKRPVELEAVQAEEVLKWARRVVWYHSASDGLDPRYPSAGRQFREAVETLRALVGSVDPEKEKEGK